MKSIAEASADLLLLAVEIQRPNVEVPDGQRLRERIVAKLGELERDAEAVGLGRTDIEDLKFAIVATIDELLHFSGRAGDLGFQIQPLQADLFGERNAGVRFYERLERIRESGESTVAEVYQLCLALGFKGLHRFEGDAHITALIDDIERDLSRSRGPLSPNGKREGGPSLPVSEFPWGAVLGGVFGLSVIAAVLLFFLLASAREEAVSVIRVLGGAG